MPKNIFSLKKSEKPPTAKADKKNTKAMTGKEYSAGATTIRDSDSHSNIANKEIARDKWKEHDSEPRNKTSSDRQQIYQSTKGVSQPQSSAADLSKDHTANLENHNFDPDRKRAYLRQPEPWSPLNRYKQTEDVYFEGETKKRVSAGME